MYNISYYITKYFSDYLPLHIGASHNTILSYRDTFLQLLDFLHQRHSIRPEKLTIEFLTDTKIEEFLEYLQTEKGAGISTINQRLAAIHSFFRYLQRKELSYFSQCGNILAIPYKKASVTTLNYLTIEEMEILFSLPDTKDKKGYRDFTILVLLYETGARVQELIDLTLCAIRFGNNPSVELHGKGNKTRLVPISQNTENILKRYTGLYRIENSSEPLFINL